MGQDLALEIDLDVVLQWHVLGVAQRGIRLGAPLLLALCAHDHVALFVAQRPLDRDRRIAEVGVVEDLAVFVLLERAVELHDALDVGLAQFLALGAERLPHLLVELGGIDELDLALALRLLVVGDDPNVGRDAGVVEHVGGQGDDGFQPVVLDDPAADLRLARARAADEKRRAIEHDANAAATFGLGPHLRDEVQQEEQAAVGHARQARAEPPLVAFLRVLVTDEFLDLFPLHAKRRIGEHVVEALAGQAVVGERVSVDDVGDVLALDEHVRLADGVGLGIQFLAEDHQASLWVEALEAFLRHREHAAGTGGGVVEGAHDASLSQRLVAPGEQELHHQTDDLARGKVLSGRLVGQLGEPADQFLEHRAHMGVAHHVGMQIDGGEFLGHQVEQVILIEPVDEQLEVELLEHVPDVAGERADVVREVGTDVGRVAQQRREGHGGGVVELVAGLLDQKAREPPPAYPSWPGIP